ncbi:MAG: hypothetical protein H7X77_10660 [Anaerolineae bacterium]|nr:hypothetical protein [Anaerolineae bacterium]
MSVYAPSAPKPRIRLLSQIEFSEKLNTLSPARRFFYAIVSALTFVGLFVAMIVLSAVLMALLSIPLGAPITAPEQVALMVIPLIGALMICIGFGGSTMPETVLPGETLTRNARRAARGGLITGALVGFFFGLIWGTAIRLHLILQVVIAIDPGTLATEILIFGVAMGLVVAPCFALFRAISSLIGTVMLDWFDK